MEAEFVNIFLNELSEQTELDLSSTYRKKQTAKWKP